MAPLIDTRRFPAITSRRGRFDHNAGGYPATVVVRRMEGLATISLDGTDRMELLVLDVDSLVRDLRRHRPGAAPTTDPTVDHRVTVVSELPTIAPRRHGVMRLRRDEEVNLLFLAVIIEGWGAFEFGFRDVDGVLGQLRRVAPPGPRLLRDIMADVFDDL